MYLAEHPALAFLEVLVHLDLPIELLPEDYVLLRVELPDELSMGELRELPTDPASAGTTWLQEKREPMLRVLSTVVPRAHNLLLNPRHPAAEMAQLLETIPFTWDPRLI